VIYIQKFKPLTQGPGNATVYIYSNEEASIVDSRKEVKRLAYAGAWNEWLHFRCCCYGWM